MSRSKSNNSKRFALIVTALAIFHFFALVSIGYATIIGVPGDYSLIQDAADNALDGDTILVENGTYTENIFLNGRKLFFVSQYAFTGNADDIANTIIDGNNADRVFELQACAGKIQGFTITNGNFAGGGAIHSWSGGTNGVDSLVFCDNIFTDNWDHALFMDLSKAVIRGNIFANNISDGAGGAIYCYDQDSSWILNNIFIENVSGNVGGAISCQGDCSVTIENNTFFNNTAGTNRGTVNIVTGSSAIIARNIVAQNAGGGIEVSPDATVTLSCNDIWNNTDGDDYHGCSPGVDDISEDPKFCDSDAGNFGLWITSPCTAANSSCGTLIGAKDVNCMETDLGYVPDLALGYETGHGVSVFIGDGEGGFNAEQNNYSVTCQGITADDFDGDGDLDIAATDILWGEVKIYFGDGTGAMTESPTPLSISHPYAIASGDFDGDTDIDLVVTRTDVYTIEVYMGDGNGDFVFSSSNGVGTHPIDIKTGNFNINDDSDLDLLVVNENSNTVSLLVNDGSGGFSFVDDYEVGSLPKQIEVADFNDDGFLDFASTNGGSDNITIYFGDGSGDFSGRSDVAVGGDPYGIGQGSFEFDYDIDLAVVNSADKTVSILLNDGTGGFSEVATYSTGAGDLPQDIAVGHLNDDGKHDLVVSCRATVSTSSINILLNDGDNRFTSFTEIPCLFFAPRSLLLDDFDRDMYNDGAAIRYVTNGNDAGEGSLREAMAISNVYEGADSIIIKQDVTDIYLYTALPDLTNDSTTICKETEGYSANIRGNSIASGSPRGVGIYSSFCRLEGVSLTGFPHDCIAMNGDGNTVTGCSVHANGGSGVGVIFSTTTLITGNYIYDNGNEGVIGWNNTDLIVSGNHIFQNTSNGIALADGIGNTFSANEIFDNGGLGIDVGGDGLTLNDDPDIDGVLNYPDIDSVRIRILLVPDTFYVYGTAAPNSTVEFFTVHENGSIYDHADPLGHGEARSFLGSTVCDGSGKFSYLVPQVLTAYSVLTATTTDELGNTSEFCENFTLVTRPFITRGFSFPGPKSECPSVIDILITDPDGNRIGYDTSGTLIEEIPDAEYHETAGCNDSIYILNPILGDYLVEVIMDRNYSPRSGDIPTYGVDVTLGSSEPVILAESAAVPESGIDTLGYLVGEGGVSYVCGDADGSEAVDIDDVVYLIAYIFSAGPAPEPIESGDSDCAGGIDIDDVVYLISYIFAGGNPPCDTDGDGTPDC